MGLETRLSGLVKRGSLVLRLPAGSVIQLGDGTGERLVVAITNVKWCARLVANPALALGEAYVEGGLIIEEGSLSSFATVIGENLRLRPPRVLAAWERWLCEGLLNTNGRRRARRNVAHHYDLSLELYSRFLDKDLQYSCAYYSAPTATLEQAQAEKKRRLARKLLLSPGMTVLDIGCGWGGLALSLARAAHVNVHGITLSEEQLEVARARARQEGLASRAHFTLTDYRDVQGCYDRIVSVGMLEHVGSANLRRFFSKVAELLADDGVAVIHTISRPYGPGATQAWVAKHIFPGGYIPAASELLRAVEQAGLVLTDLEVLRLHYARTLQDWRARFMANRCEIAERYDERFCRMWEFYLCISEVAFRYRDHSVVQLQLAKRVDAVPITRSYQETDTSELRATIAEAATGAASA